MPATPRPPAEPPPASAREATSDNDGRKSARGPGIMDVISAAAKQSQIDDNDAVMDDATRRARLQKKGSHHLHLDLHELTAHQGHSHVVFWVSFDTTGRLLLTASGDKTVKLWNLQNRKVLATFFEHEQWVYSVCFFYNSMAFATGCDDGRVRIWENTTSPVNHETGWKLTCDLGGKHDSANGHRAGVHSVSVSADDAYVVSSSADMSIKLWRRVEKECFLTLRGHTDWVTRAVFDRDCLLMASASYDTHAKLWRLSDGDDLLTFYGHKSWVSDVAWGPEGRTIATASGDFTVRLWQAKRQDGMLADGLPVC